ncbi:MAG TPA: 2-dehydro-3-deoxygalactonokinase [Candidimonas sp.]|nr:2-dehydro-3-deoxygalactonokinase [Candidimonas sp.]
MAINATSAATHLIALDWGTTSLRAVLMDTHGNTLREASSADGIMSAAERGFGQVFDSVAGKWLQDYPQTAVLAAGMIGSRQGWCEAPYVPCPAGFSELGQALVWIEHAGVPIGLVPGLAMEHGHGMPDVMRGEEVQVFGALDALGLDDGIFVLPGTHSKWVVVENRRIVRFHSFMTGEVFALLRQHSILSRLMPPTDTTPWETGCDSFLAACAVAAEGALLHNLFTVRSQGLFGKLPEALQSDYLSGLVIGEEIREALSLIGSPPERIHLVCSPTLFQRYQAALSVFGIGGVDCVPQASFRGMLAIARERALIR